MAFESDGESGKIGIQECKPDYEKQAAHEKVKAERVGTLKTALMDFIENEGTHQFRQISSIAEFLGGLEIVLSQSKKTYERLLAMVEKTQ